MQRLIATAASFAVLSGAGYGLKWIFTEHAEFGFGIFTGMAVMTVLYLIGEKTGLRPTVY